MLGAPFTNESAISKDHFIYTRTIGAEYTTYYMGGAKLTIPVKEKLKVYLYILNGWQLITDDNQQKSFAGQFEFNLNDKNLLNFNFFGGNERSAATSNYRNRYFSDVYWVHTGDKLSTTLCAYYGLQEIESAQGYDYGAWWQVNASAKYQLSKLFSIAARAEYFSDANNTMITALNNQAGVNCFGSTASFAYHFSNNGMLRLEARNFLTKQLLFNDNNSNRTNYFNWFITNITVWF